MDIKKKIIKIMKIKIWQKFASSPYHRHLSRCALIREIRALWTLCIIKDTDNNACCQAGAACHPPADIVQCIILLCLYFWTKIISTCKWINKDYPRIVKLDEFEEDTVGIKEKTFTVVPKPQRISDLHAFGTAISKWTGRDSWKNDTKISQDIENSGYITSF